MEEDLNKMQIQLSYANRQARNHVKEFFMYVKLQFTVCSIIYSDFSV